MKNDTLLVSNSDQEKIKQKINKYALDFFNYNKKLNKQYDWQQINKEVFSKHYNKKLKDFFDNKQTNIYTEITNESYKYINKYLKWGKDSFGLIKAIINSLVNFDPNKGDYFGLFYKNYEYYSKNEKNKDKKDEDTHGMSNTHNDSKIKLYSFAKKYGYIGKEKDPQFHKILISEHKFTQKLINEILSDKPSISLDEPANPNENDSLTIHEIIPEEKKNILDKCIEKEKADRVFCCANEFYLQNKSGIRNKSIVLIYMVHEYIIKQNNNELEALLQKYDFFKENKGTIKTIYNTFKKNSTQTNFAKVFKIPLEKFSIVKQQFRQFAANSDKYKDLLESIET